MSHDRQSALIKPRGKCINYCTAPVTAGEVSWVCIWLECWLWCTVEDSIILDCPNHSFIYLTQADYSFALMALVLFSQFKKCYILSSKLQTDLFYSFKTCYCASISIKLSFHTTIMLNHKIIVMVNESIWFNYQTKWWSVNLYVCVCVCVCIYTLPFKSLESESFLMLFKEVSSALYIKI